MEWNFYVFCAVKKTELFRQNVSLHSGIIYNKIIEPYFLIIFFIINEFLDIAFESVRVEEDEVLE